MSPWLNLAYFEDSGHIVYFCFCTFWNVEPRAGHNTDAKNSRTILHKSISELSFLPWNEGGSFRFILKSPPGC